MESPSTNDGETLEKVESEAYHGQQYEGYSDYHFLRHARSAPASIKIQRTTSGYSQRSRPYPVRMRSTFSTKARDEDDFTHPLAHEKTTAEYLVDFNGPDDPYRPINWPIRKKRITTVSYALLAMAASWGSSIFALAIEDVSAEFHISKVVATLGISMYLFGFATGPLLWAPLSEVEGRRKAVFVPFFIGAIFSFATGAAKDVQTIMLTRFFAGFFCSAPVTNTGGVMGDLWSPAQRVDAMSLYAIAVTNGPLVSQVVGGAIVDSYLGWRWVQYITGILMMTVLAWNIFYISESYPPKLLVYKARRLRHETDNWALHAKHEEWDISLSELGHKYLIRPWQLLFTPITACMTTYTSFVYGILYLLFAGFPIEFREERGWNNLVASLPFLSVLLGCISSTFVSRYLNGYYLKRMAANNGRPVPEARLLPMMIGSVLFPAGMFIFGWTSPKEVFWFGPVVGAFLIGAGFLMIYQGGLNYLVDTFQPYAASAVACNTFNRSMVAGGFPLFATALFHNLGIPWASSLVGFIGVAMIPIPFFFFHFGFRIRKRGKWSRPSCE